MNRVTHQTIKLSKGKHVRAEDGACVMELASMLAGETFSDSPKSVCPVIGSFLRTFNDVVGDERRQVLYVCAATVVGTAGSEEQARERAEYLASLATALQARRHPWVRLLPRRRMVSKQRQATVAARAARMLARDEHELSVNVIDVIDDLAALGSQDQPPVRPDGQPRSVASETERVIRLRQLVESPAKRH